MQTPLFNVGVVQQRILYDFGTFVVNVVVLHANLLYHGEIPYMALVLADITISYIAGLNV